MSFRNRVKKNIPQVALHSIMSLVVGTYKTGKTRLWKEVTELHYADPEDAMLLAFESGYETWELDNFIPVHEGYTLEEKPNKTGELWEVWDYFRSTVVKGLVDEAKENRVVKLLGIDTADRAVDAATAYVLHQQGKKYGKTFTSPQEISENTDTNGWVLVYEELKRQVDALRDAGYGIMSLAWTKEKETTLYDGKKYNSIELMMSNTGRKVFESQASLICCLHNEVNILDKDGKVLEENVTDKKGRDKATNFHETKTVMYFRPSEYVSIAGGRYTDLPEKVDYSAENFLEVFENAVKGQLKKTKTDVKKLDKQQEEKRDERAKEIAKEEKTKQSIQDLIKQVDAEVLRLRDAKKAGQIGKPFKEIFDGDPNGYKTSSDIEKLNKALDLAKSVK